MLIEQLLEQIQNVANDYNATHGMLDENFNIKDNLLEGVNYELLEAITPDYYDQFPISEDLLYFFNDLNIVSEDILQSLQ